MLLVAGAGKPDPGVDVGSASLVNNAGRSITVTSTANATALGSATATVPPPAVSQATRWWCWATTAACALAALALVIHREPWSSLQDNVRLWLAAGAVLCLVHRLPRYTHATDGLMGLCAAACAVSAGVALSHARDQLPGNAIPWAVSVAFLLCVLAPAVLDRGTAWARRRWWAVAQALAGVASG